MLSYEQGWVLYDNDGRQSIYDKARVVIDAGFFVLLELKNDREVKCIVIFSDQVDADSYRLFNIIVKI